MINENGYQILYVSSRSVGLANTTRNYIKKVSQENIKLPDGPILLSPGRLFESIKVEVFQRKPETVKIPILAELLKLFPLRKDLYYAGFGNKPTDRKSYIAVGVSEDNIYIIDKKFFGNTQLVIKWN